MIYRVQIGTLTRKNVFNTLVDIVVDFNSEYAHEAHNHFSKMYAGFEVRVSEVKGILKVEKEDVKQEAPVKNVDEKPKYQEYVKVKNDDLTIEELKAESKELDNQRKLYIDSQRKILNKARDMIIARYPFIDNNSCRVSFVQFNDLITNRFVLDAYYDLKTYQEIKELQGKGGVSV